MNLFSRAQLERTYEYDVVGTCSNYRRSPSRLSRRCHWARQRSLTSSVAAAHGDDVQRTLVWSDRRWKDCRTHSAINRAIEAVATTGSGALIFSRGDLPICFTIRLRSNVDLYLSRGCTILAADVAKKKVNLPAITAAPTTQPSPTRPGMFSRTTAIATGTIRYLWGMELQGFSIAWPRPHSCSRGLSRESNPAQVRKAYLPFVAEQSWCQEIRPLH